MDGSLAPQPQKDNRGLAFLEVGVFEIFFVVIILAIFFGVMNYFNILPISQIWPKQLGFLPHRESLKQNNTAIKQSNNITIAPSLVDTAKQTLLSFLPTILSQPIIPSPDVKLTQDKGIKETFSTSWDTKEGTVSAIIVLAPNGQGTVQSYISLSKFSNLPPSIALAKSTTSQLFSTQPKGKWACKPVFTTMTYCENFWEEADGTRRGLGMEGLFTQGPNLIRGQPEVMIIFCQHSKNSKLYSWKSCQFEFAQTGVK